MRHGRSKTGFPRRQRCRIRTRPRTATGHSRRMLALSGHLPLYLRSRHFWCVRAPRDGVRLKRELGRFNEKLCQVLPHNNAAHTTAVKLQQASLPGALPELFYAVFSVAKKWRAGDARPLTARLRGLTHVSGINRHRCLWNGPLRSPIDCASLSPLLPPACSDRLFGDQFAARTATRILNRLLRRHPWTLCPKLSFKRRGR